MNIAQLSEQLKDVPQAKLVDYARNPNSVVPQFLALAEIQRRQRLQSAQPGQAPQSSVAEDIMAQEPRMQGVAQLPTRAMFTEQGMAGGGIVAFAGGGELDDDDLEDYYDNREQAEALSMSAKLRSMLAQMPPSYEQARVAAGKSPRPSVAEARQATAAPVEKKGVHKYEDMVLSKAKELNNDPAFINLARHVLYKETGNLQNPESAVSKAGAKGIMQLMPATAKMLGVNPDIPEENALGGVTYLNQLYKKYNGDPVLTAAAYNAGPGRVDKALKGEGLSALPRETRMYITGLAEGGSVKGYQYGGDVQMEMGPTNAELGRVPPQSFQNEDIMLLRKDLERQLEKAKKEGDEDKYAALMQAGFAMMAGTSPYALSNIGQGALAGMGALASSKKAQAEAEKGILATRLGLAKATTAAETARQNRELIEETRRQRLELGKETAEDKRLAAVNRNISQDLNLKAIMQKLETETPGTPEYDSLRDQADNIYKFYYDQAGLPAPKLPPRPTIQPKKEEPSWWQRITGGSSKPSIPAPPAGFQIQSP